MSKIYLVGEGFVILFKYFFAGACIIHFLVGLYLVEGYIEETLPNKFDNAYVHLDIITSGFLTRNFSYQVTHNSTFQGESIDNKYLYDLWKEMAYKFPILIYDYKKSNEDEIKKKLGIDPKIISFSPETIRDIQNSKDIGMYWFYASIFPQSFERAVNTVNSMILGFPITILIGVYYVFLQFLHLRIFFWFVQSKTNTIHSISEKRIEKLQENGDIFVEDTNLIKIKRNLRVVFILFLLPFPLFVYFNSIGRFVVFFLTFALISACAIFAYILITRILRGEDFHSVVTFLNSPDFLDIKSKTLGDSSEKGFFEVSFKELKRLAKDFEAIEGCAIFDEKTIKNIKLAADTSKQFKDPKFDILFLGKNKLKQLIHNNKPTQELLEILEELQYELLPNYIDTLESIIENLTLVSDIDVYLNQNDIKILDQFAADFLDRVSFMVDRLKTIVESIEYLKENSTSSEEKDKRIKKLNTGIQEIKNISEERILANSKTIKILTQKHETSEQEKQNLAKEIGILKTEVSKLEEEQTRIQSLLQEKEKYIEKLEEAQVLGKSNVPINKHIKNWKERFSQMSDDEKQKYSAEIVSFYGDIRNTVQILRPEWLKASDEFPGPAELRATIALDRADIQRNAEEIMNSNLPDEVKTKFVENLNKELDQVLDHLA